MAARMGSPTSRRVSHATDGRGTSTSSIQTGPGEKRLVWRISDAAPLGVWVDPTISAAASRRGGQPLEVMTGGFLASSFDLLQGTDVQEIPGDKVPDELLDQFFPELAEKKQP